MKPQHDNELRARLFSFKYAFAGIVYTLRNERNAWIHAVITIIIIGLGAWLRIGRIEWAILVLTILLIFMGEIINTAIEALVDLVSPDFHPLAKVAKDAAAGAVLFGAVGAVIIGLIILGPPLWDKLSILWA